MVNVERHASQGHRGLKTYTAVNLMGLVTNVGSVILHKDPIANGDPPRKLILTLVDDTASSELVLWDIHIDAVGQTLAEVCAHGKS